MWNQSRMIKILYKYNFFSTIKFTKILIITLKFKISYWSVWQYRSHFHIFALHASLMHASLPSLASVYKTFDHVFIVHVLSPKCSPVSSKFNICPGKISRDVLQVGWMNITRNPRVRNRDVLAFYLYDGFTAMNELGKHNTVLTSCKDVIHIIYTYMRQNILERSLITMRYVTFGIYCCFRIHADLLCTRGE